MRASFILLALASFILSGSHNRAQAEAQGQSQSQAKIPVAKPAASQQKSSDNTAVTAEIRVYETKYFERHFEGETIDKRLDRLENFIFGATNSGSANSRTAQIVAAVGVPTVVATAQNTAAPGKSAKDVPAAGYSRGSYNDSSSSASTDWSSQSPGSYPRVTALESEILGQTYATQPLIARLNRMELKVFGNPSHSDDLSARTDALDQYAQVKLHIKPQAALAVNPQMEGSRSGPAATGNSINDANPFVRSLRSMAGGPAPMNPMAMTSPGGSYDVDDDDPAAAARKKMIEQQLADAARPNAPSAHERTLSRVAWCEMQLFGKSYPQMHLLQRLHQLNSELFPTDKEKDIQLMDRIDVIVRAVVLRKHPPQAA